MLKVSYNIFSFYITFTPCNKSTLCQNMAQTTSITLTIVKCMASQAVMLAILGLTTRMTVMSGVIERSTLVITYVIVLCTCLFSHKITKKFLYRGRWILHRRKFRGCREYITAPSPQIILITPSPMPKHYFQTFLNQNHTFCTNLNNFAQYIIILSWRTNTHQNLFAIPPIATRKYMPLKYCSVYRQHISLTSWSAFRRDVV